MNSGEFVFCTGQGRSASTAGNPLPTLHYGKGLPALTAVGDRVQKTNWRIYGRITGGEKEEEKDGNKYTKSRNEKHINQKQKTYGGSQRMRKKWEIKIREEHYYPGHERIHKQSLAELTDILYSYFCQLEKSSTQAQATCAVSKPLKEDT